MVAAESLPIEERVLQTTKNRGALRGFSNLLGKEYGSWWTTRRWFVHLLLWPVLLNGLVLVLSFSLSKEPHFTAFEIAQMVTTLFFIGMGQVAAFGAVVATQSALTGEKQRGTAAWIMSKPVRRDVFLLAKLAAQTVSFLSLAVVIPSTIFFGQSRILWGESLDLVLYVTSVLVVLLHVLFYLALTLMLGTFFRGSGPVAGIGVGMLLGGVMMQERLKTLTRVMPWELPDIGALIAVQAPMVRVGMPIVATAFWTVLVVVIALWRFRRDEF